MKCWTELTPCISRHKKSQYKVFTEHHSAGSRSGRGQQDKSKCHLRRRQCARSAKPIGFFVLVPFSFIRLASQVFVESAAWIR